VWRTNSGKSLKTSLRVNKRDEILPLWSSSILV
jgi:hypothetical protein